MKGPLTKDMFVLRLCVGDSERDNTYSVRDSRWRKEEKWRKEERRIELQNRKARRSALWMPVFVRTVLTGVVMIVGFFFVFMGVLMGMAMGVLMAVPCD